MPVIRHELFYGCCPEPYPDVTFYIQLQRKPLFYLLNLLFPCTLISTIAILGFLLPPDSGEKVSLEITVLLSLAVFLLVVSETMPPTSETFPFIGKYRPNRNYNNYNNNKSCCKKMVLNVSAKNYQFRSVCADLIRNFSCPCIERSGHIVLPLSVCPSVCLSVCTNLTQKLNILPLLLN